jgi:hypothetical protein
MTWKDFTLLVLLMLTIVSVAWIIADCQVKIAALKPAPCQTK